MTSCGAGYGRERLMPAFARGSGFAGGEHERGEPLSSARRPGLDRLRGGRRAGPGPAGLAMAFARLSKRVFGVGLCGVHERPCYPGAPRPRVGLRPGPRPHRIWWTVGVPFGTGHLSSAPHAGNRRGLGTRCQDEGRLQWARHGSSLRYGVQLVSAGSVCVTGASGGGFDDVGDGPGFVSRRCGLRRGAGVCAATRIAGILAGAWRVCLRAGRWLGVGTDRRCLGVCWHGQALLCLAAPS